MPSPGTHGIELVATRSDYEQVIRAVESTRPLKYIDYGMKESTTRDVYTSGMDIPDLGIARRGISITEQTYLVLPLHLRIVTTPVPQIKGGILYDVDPLDHPGSVMFRSSGVYSDDTLVSGTIYTALTDSDAIGTIRDFKREIKKRFTRVQEFWFGPEALSLHESGMRATQDIRSVPELDIRRV